MIRSIVKNKNLYFILGVLFIFVIWDLGKIYFNNDYIVPGVEETFYALIKLLKKPKTGIEISPNSNFFGSSTIKLNSTWYFSLK